MTKSLLFWQPEAILVELNGCPQPAALQSSPSVELCFAVLLLVVASMTLPKPLAGEVPGNVQAHGRPAAQFREKVWNRENGLPENEVTALLQSSDGYIWVATRAGLCRFDGLTFKTFSHLSDPAFHSDYCISLAQDDKGQIWIGTQEGLVSFLAGRFRRIQGSFDRSPVRVYWSRRSGIWLLAGSYIFQQSGSAFSEWTLENRGLPFSLSESDDGVIWLGTGDGLVSLNPRTGKQKEFRNGIVNKHLPVFGTVPLADGSIFGLVQTPPLAGVRPYLVKGDQWTCLSSIQIENYRGSYPAVRDPDGAIWIPRGASGLQTFQNGALTPREMATNDVVLCVLHDSNRNIWVGTERSGLRCYLRLPFSSIDQKHGLLNENTWAFAEEPGGRMWIGTDEGITGYPESMGETLRQYTTTNGLPKNTVRALAEDEHGNLWIGTGNGLVFLSDKGSLQSWNFSGKPWYGDPDQLAWNKIRALAPAPNGSLWLGAAAGLYRFTTNEYVLYDNKKGFPGDDVRALEFDRRGNLWIGSVNTGLILYSNKQFFQFTTTNGLSANAVWAIHQDLSGTLWLGTERGLNRFKDGVFSSFAGIRDSPLAQIINHVIEDDYGNLWLSQEKGICRVSLEKLNAFAEARTSLVPCMFFDSSDGMPTSETNGQKSQPAAIKRRNGELWFATPKGVAIVDPKRFQATLSGPTTVIEELRANDQPVFRDGGILTRLTKAGLVHSNGVQMAPGAGRVLEFRFTANDFLAPEKCRFKFRLDGYDTEWHEAGTRRAAFYTNLSPGKYRFRVLACNHRNLWSEKEASLAFVLAPFFYETWFFRILVALLAGATIMVIHSYRVRYHREIDQLQGKLAVATERARVARDLHDGVGSALTQLRLLAALAEREQAITSGPSGTIRKMSQLTQELNDSLREIIWLARPESQTLEGLLTRACEQAEGLARLAGIRSSFELPAEIPQLRLPPGVSENLHFAIKEAIHNAVRHSRATTLEIIARIDDARLSILIRDDGAGFDPHGRYSSSGLMNMRTRIESSGGSFELRSQKGQGTSVLMNLPIRGKSG